MRAARLAFVLTFVLLMLLPGVEMAYPFVAIHALDEKRRLAPPPDFTAKILHGDGRLAGDINRWFDDRIGFRPFFTRLSHQIDYSLFAHADKVYVGSDGWLFAKDMIEPELDSIRQGKTLDAKLQRLFASLQNYLEHRGIRLVIVSNPSKESIEAGHLPLNAPRLPTDSPFQRLRTFLGSHKEWIYVDGESVEDSCGSYQLFFRLDEHILTPTAYCIAKEIVHRIAIAEGHSGDYWDPDLTWHEGGSTNGGDVSYLSILSNLTETIDVINKYYDVYKAPAEGAFNLNVQTYAVHDPRRPYEWVYHTYDQYRDKKLPPLVWYGNSFTDLYILAGLQFQFTDVYRLRSNEVSLTDALKRIPPSTKYFMIQFLEPYLVDLAANDIRGE